MSRILISLAIGGLFAVMIPPAARAQLIYSNGPTYPNGPTNTGPVSYWISQGYTVSDSFTVASAVNLSSATVGIWNDPGATQTSIAWQIGTAPGASDISSGVSSTEDVFQYSLGVFDVYEASFDISGAVTPGVYWITLQNDANSDNGVTGWDDNNGPSVAYQFATPPNVSRGNLQNNWFGGSNSNSFQIYGAKAPVNSTPEPGMFAMAAGLGMSGWTILRRWRRRVSMAPIVKI